MRTILSKPLEVLILASALIFPATVFSQSQIQNPPAQKQTAVTSIDAHNIAKEISKSRNNPERASYVAKLAEEASKRLGRELVIQQIYINGDKERPLSERFGNKNYIIPSKSPNPITIGAHYDAADYDSVNNQTVPGANDNGSGVGTLAELTLLPDADNIEFVFLGSEERDRDGARQYSSELRNRPRLFISLDTVGKGEILNPDGIYGMKGIEEKSNIFPTDTRANQIFREICRRKGLKVLTEDLEASGDQSEFVIRKIPTFVYQRVDEKFIGDDKEDGDMHTLRDDERWLDENQMRENIQLLSEFIGAVKK